MKPFFFFFNVNFTIESYWIGIVMRGERHEDRGISSSVYVAGECEDFGKIDARSSAEGRLVGDGDGNVGRV